MEYIIIENIISIITILIALVFHEVAHGYIAYMLGDPTAKYDGRLSLNPLRHIDPIGAILFIIFKFGFAKPVSVNPGYFKNPRRDIALTALAGPISNILLAFLMYLIAYPLMLTPFGRSYYFYLFFRRFVYINIALAVFNLLPIYPLDGSKIFSFLIRNTNSLMYKIISSQIGFAILILVIFTGFYSIIVTPIVNIIISSLDLLIRNLYFFI
jgi:Zn-dependent protease